MYRHSKGKNLFGVGKIKRSPYLENARNMRENSPPQLGDASTIREKVVIEFF